MKQSKAVMTAAEFKEAIAALRQTTSAGLARAIKLHESIQNERW